MCPTHGVLAVSCRVHVCAVSWATWLLFTGVPVRCVALRVRCPGLLAPVHRCARSVCCVACAVSLATWLLFTSVPARCAALRVRCPGPLDSCSPVCRLGVLLCWCGVLGLLAPVHQCARSVHCFACAVSWATWLLFTGVPAWCVALRVRCPGPLGSCSPMCPLGVFCWLCGVLGHLAPVHRCARSVRCFACAVSLTTWLLFAGVRALCVVWCVRCPGPLGSCSPVCPLGVLCCVCGVKSHFASVHRCAPSVCCVACAVSCATWLLFSGVPARCVALGVGCPGPLGSSSPVCPLGALLCVCGVLGNLAPVQQCALRPLLCLCGVLDPLAPVHQCARSVCRVACAVSWATCLLFTGVRAPSVALLVRCPGPLGSWSPMCPLGVLCCVCGVLGYWLLVTDVRAPSVALLVRCPGPLGSWSVVCLLGVLCCVCGVLGHLAPAHRCARLVRCFVCAVSTATWLQFTSVPARCVVLRVRCPGPLGSCSPVCSFGVLCCGVRSTLGKRRRNHKCE